MTNPTSKKAAAIDTLLRESLQRTCPELDLRPSPWASLGEDPLQRENALQISRRPPPIFSRASYLSASALTLGCVSQPAAMPTAGGPGAQPPRQDPMHQCATPPGPLRNGNPRGNPNAAPRCGARTRAGTPCRSPAMPNGRCRMHGGRSTGPRTLAGLDRLRAATTKHGGYAMSASRRARDPLDPFALHAMRTAVTDTKRLLALIRRSGPAGPDETALLALLRPAPLPFRRHRRGDPMQRENGRKAGPVAPGQCLAQPVDPAGPHAT